MSWRSSQAAAQAEAEVALADEHLARLADLAERGARASADDALLAAGHALRHARPLSEVAADLGRAAEQLDRLAHEVARVRAAVEGVEL